MYVGAGTATIATLSASMLTINALIDSNHRIRPELLIPRDSVNRFESILISLQYVASLLYRWRRGTIERDSPFPTHVNEPLPFQHTPTPSHAKDEKSSIDYGSTSVDAPKKETTIQAE